MANWWFDDQGKNNLKGVPGDPFNRLVLPDSSIVQFLIDNPFARRDFQLLVPTMLPDEQTRLNGIIARRPRLLFPEPDLDPQIQDDRLMNNFNKSGAFFDPNRRK